MQPGAPFFFKLHAPKHFIVGGGFFAYWSVLPISLAWSAFGLKNGALSLEEMGTQIARYRDTIGPRDDPRIGCNLLQEPFFFPEHAWIPAPSDWPMNTVRGKSYDLTSGLGKVLWTEVQARLRQIDPPAVGRSPLLRVDPAAGYSEPYLTSSRLGQGSFRVIVTDAFERRCAFTGERTLPVLDAAHIRPYSLGGPHSVENGLLLRRDLHTLFDLGYVTATPDYRIRVSRRIRDEFENGRDYYALEDRPLRSPREGFLRPNREFLAWHNDEVFRV